jgi:hypothetical protein
MLPVLVLAFLVGCFTVQTKMMPPALRFGETKDDYVELPDGIMNDATSQFSLCSWIKKRFITTQPILFHYWHPGSYIDIRLSDNGYFNRVVGTDTRLVVQYEMVEI